MGKFVIHTSHDLQLQQQERSARFLLLPFEKKLSALFSLIRSTVMMNGGRPIKRPQGKGVIIKKPS